jgi:hypothetical protein
MPDAESVAPSLRSAGSGVDRSQIEARLRLTPADRFRLGVTASRRMIALRQRLRPLDQRADVDRV